MKRDLEYIETLFVDFFQQESITDSLSIIDEYNIKGWEVWLQVEFAKFLLSHQSKPEWDREFKLEFDKRKEKEKDYFKPDFRIRKKGWAYDKYVILEMKQNNSPSTCLTKMFEDLSKVSKIRGSEMDIRTLWAFGIFKNNGISDNDVKVLIFEKAKESEFSENAIQKHCRVQQIEKTDYSYVLLGVDFS